MGSTTSKRKRGNPDDKYWLPLMEYDQTHEKVHKDSITWGVEGCKRHWLMRQGLLRRRTEDPSKYIPLRCNAACSNYSWITVDAYKQEIHMHMKKYLGKYAPDGEMPDPELI